MNLNHINDNKNDWGLHWFRRDLRVYGNCALRKNWMLHKGNTLGLFCFDSQFLSRSDFSANRFGFFINTLMDLSEELRKLQGDLLVVDDRPQIFFPKFFSFLDKNQIPLPKTVTWNRDYEPFARQRDAEIEKILVNKGITVLTERDHLLFEPHEILKSSASQNDSNSFYQVYSPFGRKWMEALLSTEGQNRLLEQKKVMQTHPKQPQAVFNKTWDSIKKIKDFPWKDALSHFQEMNQKNVTVPLPKGGFKVAQETWRNFLPAIDQYQKNRDYPYLQGTSRMSYFLKNGSITVPQILSTLNLQKLNWSQKNGLTTYVKELAWREFYYSILYHRPDVETQSFLPQFANIKWENNAIHFERWKTGQTGFPIVDAGMRELLTTGWMHNRVRMIVASFLTKDLLIDWKWGEKYFMHQLLDGDLACNNGGWQWAASTGCDPQPYFRIFNPWLQGQKFDPDGTYIRQFVPELASAPHQILHEPTADRSSYKYPPPMVNHSTQRLKALQLYKP